MCTANLHTPPINKGINSLAGVVPKRRHVDQLPKRRHVDRSGDISIRFAQMARDKACTLISHRNKIMPIFVT